MLGLRLDLNMGTTWSLPEWSVGPHGDEQAVLEAARAAGFQGVQGANPRRMRGRTAPHRTALRLRAALGGLMGERARAEGQRPAEFSAVWRRTGERLARAVERGEIRHDIDTAGLILPLDGVRAPVHRAPAGRANR